MVFRLPIPLLTVLLLCGLYGCSDSPVDAMSAELTVVSLEASSIRQDVVDLRWQCADTTITSFLVSWNGEGQRDSGSNVTDRKELRVEGLQGGAYTFQVVPRRGQTELTPTFLTWAGARRFDSDPRTGEPLRLYERFSSRATGLVIDLVTGNPRLLDLTLPVTFPPVPVALRISTASLISTEFSIGPPAAYLPLMTSLDSIAAVSEVAYAVASLDDWFLSRPIHEMIDNDGHFKAFNRIPAAPGNSTGIGFLLRVGFGTTDFPWHYARVLVKNNGGRLLQGTAPDRYVDIEISYQTAADLPFARRAALPVLYRSERRP